MKGITPVLSLILLIIIVIVVIGFSFGFFSNIISSTAETAESQISQEVEELSICLRIESVSGDTLYVRNCGSEILTENNIIVTAEGSNVPIIGSVYIDPGSIGRVFLHTSSLEDRDYEFKVSAGHSQDIIEFRPSGNVTCSTESDCPYDGFLLQEQCDGFNIFDTYRNYSCQNSTCVYNDSTGLKEHCDLSCYGNVCNTHPGFGSPGTPNYPCTEDENLTLFKTRFDWIDQSFYNGYGYSNANTIRLGLYGVLYFVNAEGKLMSGYNQMYEVTGDMYYLNKLVYHADRVLSLRDDFHRDGNSPYGLRDYSGRIGKTWSFKQESSENLYVQYEQTTGILSLPLVDFARIVYDDPSLWGIVVYDGMTMKQKADFYIARARESVAEHDHLWFENGTEGYYRIYDPDPNSTECATPSWNLTSCIEWDYYNNYIDEDEGYYACPENTAPIPYERACVPKNQQGRLIKVITRLYELTGEAEYWNKMQGYSEFYKNNLEYDPVEDVYTTTQLCYDMYTGWEYDQTRCPYEFAGHTETEKITYFSLGMGTVYMLYEHGLFNETEMQRLANTFTENIYIDSDSLAWYVDGSLGPGFSEDIRASSGFFRLIEFDSSIYNMLNNFYILGPDHPRNSEFNYYYSTYSSIQGYAQVIKYCGYSS